MEAFLKCRRCIPIFPRKIFIYPAGGAVSDGGSAAGTVRSQPSYNADRAGHVPEKLSQHWPPCSLYNNLVLTQITPQQL
jgi:hypothetical protein